MGVPTVVAYWRSLLDPDADTSAEKLREELTRACRIVTAQSSPDRVNRLMMSAAIVAEMITPHDFDLVGERKPLLSATRKAQQAVQVADELIAVVDQEPPT